MINSSSIGNGPPSGAVVPVAVDVSKSNTHFAPYLLENKTGVAVKYIMCAKFAEMEGNTKEKFSEKTVTGIVASGECAPLVYPSFFTDLSTESKHFSVLSREVRVQLDGMRSPSAPLRVDKGNFGHFLAELSGASALWGSPGLAPLPDDHEDLARTFKTPVLYNVSIHHYSKKITLSSTVTILSKSVFQV